MLNVSGGFFPCRCGFSLRLCASNRPILHHPNTFSCAIHPSPILPDIHIPTSLTIPLPPHSSPPPPSLAKVKVEARLTGSQG